MTVVNNALHQDFASYPQFGVLQGVKVFITGTNIAGPFAGCLMAEMGAQVVQAEMPKIVSTRIRNSLAKHDKKEEK